MATSVEMVRTPRSRDSTSSSASMRHRRGNTPNLERGLGGLAREAGSFFPPASPHLEPVSDSESDGEFDLREDDERIEVERRQRAQQNAEDLAEVRRLEKLEEDRRTRPARRATWLRNRCYKTDAWDAARRNRYCSDGPTDDSFFELCTDEERGKIEELGGDQLLADAVSDLKLYLAFHYQRISDRTAAASYLQPRLAAAAAAVLLFFGHAPSTPFAIVMAVISGAIMTGWALAWHFDWLRMVSVYGWELDMSEREEEAVGGPVADRRRASRLWIPTVLSVVCALVAGFV